LENVGGLRNHHGAVVDTQHIPFDEDARCDGYGGVGEAQKCNNVEGAAVVVGRDGGPAIMLEWSRHDDGETQGVVQAYGLYVWPCERLARHIVWV
jgi:hypothetical protein